MELVKEFKETEVGLVPNDWKTIVFGQLISNLCYGPRFSAKDYSIGGNVKTIRGTDINHNGDIKYEQVPIAKLPSRLVRDHKLLDGDLVMITTAECGLTGVYIDDGFPYIASAYAVRITLNTEAHSLFFKYIFQTRFAKEQVELYIRKGTVANLPGSGILKFKFALPTLPEQKAIAKVLSDTDKLIQSLEKKIAKKKLIKQGVMQKLLTPKEGWEVKKLGEVCVKIQDGNYGESYPKSYEFLRSGIPFLTSKAIGKNGVLKTESIDYISAAKHKLLTKAHIEFNDILFTNRGASVGAIGYVDNRIAGGNIGPQLTLIRVNSEIINSRYLFQYLKTERFRKQIIGKDSGSAMNFFGIGQTEKFELYAPNLDEQIVISTVLDDLDNEVLSLNLILSKYKTIKQGLMQQLLTGKIRLSCQDK